jgi:hypothetical protein
MKVKILGPLGTPPIELDATVVMVTKDDGTPFFAAGHVGHGRGTIMYSQAGSPDFQSTLVQLGYDRTVIVDKLKGR